MNKQTEHLTKGVLVFAVILYFSYRAGLVVLKSFEFSNEVVNTLTIITMLSFSIFIYGCYGSLYFMSDNKFKVR